MQSAKANQDINATFIIRKLSHKLQNKANDILRKALNVLTSNSSDTLTPCLLVDRCLVEIEKFGFVVSTKHLYINF